MPRRKYGKMVHDIGTNAGKNNHARRPEADGAGSKPL